MVLVDDLEESDFLRGLEGVQAVVPSVKLAFLLAD